MKKALYASLQETKKTEMPSSSSSSSSQNKLELKVHASHVLDESSQDSTKSGVSSENDKGNKR